MKNKNRSSLRNLVRATRGANMVEYIILVGLVALIAIAGFGSFGKRVQERVAGQADSVSHVTNDGVAGN